MTFRNVCFTLYQQEDEIKFSDSVTYCVWQREKCPTTGKEHIQGYMELSKTMRLSAIKSILGNTAHIEARKGTQEQAINYCKKEETRLAGPWEHGTPKALHRKKVSELSNAVTILKARGVAGVAEELPEVFIRNFRGLSALAQYLPVKRDFKTIVEVYIGPSGSGKSRTAWENYPNAYPKDNSKWWDGYNGTDVIIWDDFKHDAINYQDLLKIMDRYPMKVEIKGGSIWFAPSRIIFTMIQIPSHFDVQFSRRIDHLTTLSCVSITT